MRFYLLPSSCFCSSWNNFPMGKNNYYLPKAHKVCVVLVLGAVIVAGFVAGLAGSGMSAFVAFSASWFTICALALGAAVATLYPAYLNHQLLFSENVFLYLCGILIQIMLSLNTLEYATRICRYT